MPIGMIFGARSVAAFTYEVSEALPGMTSTSVSNTGDYLSNLFYFLLGAAAVLAVVKIVMGGLKYIYSSMSPPALEEAKADIQAAVFGLILALASYLILYTINPNLLTLDFTVSETTTSSSGGSAGSNGGSTSSGGTTTTQPGGAIGTGNENHNDEGPSGSLTMGAVSDSLKPLEDVGSSLTKDNTYIVVDKSAKTISVYKDNQFVASTNINIGYADKTGTQTGGNQGDNITPVGEFTITNDIRRDSVNGVYTNDGSKSLGAAFMGISATDQNGNYRGIGIHARADDKLSSTNGCVRTSNADV
ncbi:MAG: L,D-transpeptidase, partial [Candidatus Niyogibacteria bacterium]|nr:L,D-transpeptidase [Candidatus Niyogibacteria bacterium]